MTEAEQERAKVVAYLRKIAEAYVSVVREDEFVDLATARVAESMRAGALDCAERIERREHLG